MIIITSIIQHESRGISTSVANIEAHGLSYPCTKSILLKTPSYGLNCINGK